MFEIRPRHFAILQATVLLAVTAACSRPASDHPRVGFITNSTSDFWSLAEAGVKQAEADFGVDCSFLMPADGSVENQQRLLENLIAQGAAACAVSPIDPANQTAALDRAALALKLITVDSDAPASRRIAYVGTDNVAAGRAAARLLMEALPRGGPVMLFVGRLDALNAQQRIQGLREELEGSGITILDVRTDLTDRARAKSNVEDALARHADLAGLVGLWSYNGPAILSAVKDAGRTGAVQIVCFDEEPDTLQGVEDGVIHGTIVQDPWTFGVESVRIMAALARGENPRLPPGGLVDVPVRTLRKGDIATFRGEIEARVGAR